MSLNHLAVPENMICLKKLKHNNNNYLWAYQIFLDTPTNGANCKGFQWPKLEHFEQ